MDFNLTEIQLRQIVTNHLEGVRTLQKINLTLSVISLFLTVVFWTFLVPGCQGQIVLQNDPSFVKPVGLIQTFDVIGGERGIVFDGNLHETQSFFPTDVGTSIQCYQKGLVSAMCMSFFTRGYYDLLNCEGSMNEEYHCSSEYRDCSCRKGIWEGQERDESNRVLVRAEIVAFDELTQNMDPFDWSFNRSSGIKVSLSLDNFKYKFVTNDPGPFYVILRKMGYSIRSFGSGYKFEVPSDTTFKKISGDIEIKVIHVKTGAIVLQQRTYEPAFSKCDFFPDLASTSPFRVPSCYEPYQVVLWFLLWISLIALPILLCISCVGLVSTKITKRVSQPTLPSLHLMIVLFSLGSLACQMSYHTISEVTNCHSNPQGVTECFPNQIVTFTIPYPGAEVCINIQDSANKTVSQIIVTSLAFESVRSYSNTYYSTDWWFAYQSVMRCAGTSACNGPDYIGDPPPPDYCDLTVVDHDRDAYGQLSSSWCAQYPGETTCSGGLGTMSNGCVYADSCVFSCYALVPTNGWFEVHTLNSPVYKTYVKVGIPDKNFEVAMTTGQPYFYNGVELRQVSVSGDIMDPFPMEYNSVFTAGGKLRAGMASFKGAPEKGKIGDVQALTMSDANNKNFYYDPEIVSGPRVVNEEAKYDAVPSAVGINGDMGPYTELPGMINGNLWDADELALKSNLTNGASVTYSLTFSSNFYVTFVSEDVCPLVESNDIATGCFDCQSGFSFNLTAHSFCKKGYANVASEGSATVQILTSTILLEEESRNFTIYGKSSSKDVDTSICITADGEKVCFNLVGVLNEVTSNFTQHSNSTYDEDKGVSVPDTNEHDCGDDPFSRFFNGCPKWWDYVIVVPVLILCLVLVLAILLITGYLIFQLLKACLGGKLEQWRVKQNLKQLQRGSDERKTNRLLRKLKDGKRISEEETDFLAERGYSSDFLEAILDNLPVD